MDKKQIDELVDKGSDLGLRFLKQALAEGYDLPEIYAACAITMENIEKVAKLLDILGPEKFDELGGMLMKIEQEKVIGEAEEALENGE